MKKRVSIPLVIVAGGLVYALVVTPPELIAPPTPAGGSDEPAPDSYAGDVTVRVFGATGQLLDSTLADGLERFRRRGVIELDAPQRRGFGGDDAWSASAQRGELLEGSEILRLHGEVSLRNDTDDVEFRTESMVIDMGEQTARSLAPVRSWQGDNEMMADSLWVHFEREIAVLSGNVRGLYQPEG